MKVTLTLIPFLLILCLPLSLAGQCHELIKIREMCSVAFLNNNPDVVDNELKQPRYSSPVYGGYRSVMLILHAKISNSPIDKIRYFNKGKDLLERTIKNNHENLELRYLRFCIQTNIPFFLFYNGNIESDKKFIIENWNVLADEDLRIRIKKYMTISEHCNTIEKNFFING